MFIEKISSFPMHTSYLKLKSIFKHRRHHTKAKLFINRICKSENNLDFDLCPNIYVAMLKLLSKDINAP